jgi:DNA-binding winged helix-turn-helix (wHTH) protein/PAS domain-containing protein
VPEGIDIGVAGKKRLAIFDSSAPTIAELRAVNERLLLANLRERAARETAERLAAAHAVLLSQSSDGVIIVDPSGQVTYVNGAARRLDGTLEAGRSLATPAQEEMPGAEPPLHLLASLPACRALRGETVSGVEGRIVRDDGTAIIVRSCGAPLLSEEGRLIGALVRLQELTDTTASEDRDALPDFQVGDLAIHYRTKQVTLKGQPIKLSPIEYQLLYRLARNAGRVLPVQTLLDRVWGTTVTAYTDYVKIYVHRLRAKIERQGGPRYIETVRGLGYRFMGSPARQVQRSGQ